jgi:tetratricopeptide (TPR) repeat protein
MDEKGAEVSVNQKSGDTVSSGGAGEYIRKAYESLKKGNADSALKSLREALRIDFEHKEVLYALKCLNWWLEKIKRLDDFHNPYERGVFILSRWKSYYGFLDKIGEIPAGEAADSCQYALRRFIFTRALDNFLVLLGDGTNQQDPDLLLQAGRCCKGAGDWEESLKYLERAGYYRKEDSGILSELADVKALLGDERAAKSLFREAFYIEPEGIDLSGLESEMIVQLRDRVRGLGYSGPELAEWIPVWGCVWGIFSIKRELKPVELGRLKQSILSLENENRSAGGAKERVRPRLLNRYFWLIDYCEQNRDASGLVDETMLKIKFIDPVVYQHYRT